ncbi:hypothetical protein [Yeosuana marina]|uniref:hypothetical protein n=1 Tax=Yeosuana marina TaxID=1565536 RepID=UPI001422584F|nr:hypothetical protein [Yeosuana marina]
MGTLELQKKDIACSTHALSFSEMEEIIAGKECGQYVVDCLGDAYSNHGWVSVWAIVQSAFIPETAVALAVACYIDC